MSRQAKHDCVLVVDDDPALIVLYSRILKRAGIPFDTATDGVAAIEKLRRASYGAVVLDLMMPKANGFEVLQFLSATKVQATKRVIIVTAASERTLAQFDASKYWTLLRKPFDLAELMAAINGCMAQEEAPPSSPGRGAVEQL